MANYSNSIILDDDDDDDDVIGAFELGALDTGNMPVFSYEFLLTEELHPHSSRGKSCEVVDYKYYFEQVKKLSGIPISELLKIKELHFKYELPKGNQLALLLDAIGKKKLSINERPMVGHFALYTPKTFVQGGKCPRVYFFVGKNAILFIIGFDMFHQISPMKQH